MAAQGCAAQGIGQGELDGFLSLIQIVVDDRYGDDPAALAIGEHHGERGCLVIESGSGGSWCQLDRYADTAAQVAGAVDRDRLNRGAVFVDTEGRGGKSKNACGDIVIADDPADWR